MKSKREMMNLNIIYSTGYNLKDVGFGKYIYISIYIFWIKPTLLICKWMYFYFNGILKIPSSLCVRYSNTTTTYLPPSFHHPLIFFMLYQLWWGRFIVQETERRVCVCLYVVCCLLFLCLFGKTFSFVFLVWFFLFFKI